MKEGFGKKLLAVLLAGTMVSSCLPVFAEEEAVLMETEEPVEEEVIEVPDEEIIADETVVETPEDEFIAIDVESSDEFQEEIIDIPVEEEESAVVEVESTGELPEDEAQTALWTYQYAGNPNIYLQTICEWMAVYHAESAIPETGMIPAISIVGFDDADRSDIKLYGFFQIADYSVDGTTLVAENEELITGCMHLQQLSEEEYIVQKAEILDKTNLTGSARTLTGGDPSLMKGLLTGGISEAERAQYIRDFVWTYAIGAEAYQDSNGLLHPINYEADSAPEWVSDLVEAECTDQIVTVGTTDGRNALLSLHEKQEDGSWLCLLEVPAMIGKEGLGKTVEGDNRTPVGTYGFTTAFGLAEDPGSGIPYTQCNESYYWNKDSASGRYNQLVTTDQYTEFSLKESTRITDRSHAYRYAVALSYNEDGDPYSGSGVFLQCRQPQSFWTDGSIAIPEEAMAELLQHLNTGARVIIDTMDHLKTHYLSAEARKSA